MVDAASRLSLAPPPAYPTDLTPSALFLSLSCVSPAHIGRKLRLVVQILALDHSHKATHILATSSAAAGARNLLLLRVDGVLLGRHSSLQEERWDGPQAGAEGQDSRGRGVKAERGEKAGKAETGPGRPPALRGGARIPREPLALRAGEWICAVGWLEASDLARSIAVPAGYAAPPAAVLECIHVSMARGPPVGGVCRGDLG